MSETAEERGRALHRLLEELIQLGFVFTEDFIYACMNMAEVLSEVRKSLEELSEAMSSEDYNSDIRQRRFLERKYRTDRKCPKPQTKIAAPCRINIFKIQHRGCC